MPVLNENLISEIESYVSSLINSNQDPVLSLNRQIETILLSSFLNILRKNKYDPSKALSSILKSLEKNIVSSFFRKNLTKNGKPPLTAVSNQDYFVGIMLQVMSCDITNVPLYLNDTNIVQYIAKWRLSHPEFNDV